MGHSQDPEGEQTAKRDLVRGAELQVLYKRYRKGGEGEINPGGHNFVF